MTRSYFQQLAAYNRWANARIYEAAMAMPDEMVRRRTGVFFGSLHGTLNHLVVTDRIWLKRITGVGQHPNRLDAIVHDALRDLAQARIADDARIIAVVAQADEEALARDIVYHTTSGTAQRQALSDILLHLFNHQTHHRSQAHTCVSILTGAEPPTLDLLAYQRGAAAPDLQKLVSEI